MRTTLVGTAGSSDALGGGWLMGVAGAYAHPRRASGTRVHPRARARPRDTVLALSPAPRSAPRRLRLLPRRRGRFAAARRAWLLPRRRGRFAAARRAWLLPRRRGRFAAARRAWLLPRRRGALPALLDRARQPRREVARRARPPVDQPVDH